MNALLLILDRCICHVTPLGQNALVVAVGFALDMTAAV